MLPTTRPIFIQFAVNGVFEKMFLAPLTFAIRRLYFLKSLSKVEDVHAMYTVLYTFILLKNLLK